LDYKADFVLDGKDCPGQRAMENESGWSMLPEKGRRYSCMNGYLPGVVVKPLALCYDVVGSNLNLNVWLTFFPRDALEVIH